MSIRFDSDYTEGCHPKILEALGAANAEQNPGYGMDAHCAHARELIRAACAAPDADVHFLVGGTQVNTVVIAAALREYGDRADVSYDPDLARRYAAYMLRQIG